MKARLIPVVFCALAGLVVGVFLSPPAQAAEREFYVMGVELKGRASADKEPFPGNTLPAGDGFEVKKPGKDGKWVVESYVFNPSHLTVNQGDKVTIHFVGINGSLHTIKIEKYHPKRISLKRGRMKTVSFTADEAGVFRIKCFQHEPSMTGQLVVLKK